MKATAGTAFLHNVGTIYCSIEPSGEQQNLQYNLLVCSGTYSFAGEPTGAQSNLLIHGMCRKKKRSPDPGQRLVPALLDDLEVSDLDAADREIWDLELHLRT